MSWNWVGPFSIREYLENPAQAWPPDFNAVYFVTAQPWTPETGPSNALYVGTSFTDRLRARVGDLIADLLGLGSANFEAHHIGGFKVWKYWYGELGRNPMDLFLGWWVQSNGGDCVVCAEIFLWDVFGHPPQNGGIPHHKSNRFFSCLCMQTPAEITGVCHCSFQQGRESGPNT